MKILHEMTIHLIVCIVYDFIADPFSLLIDVKLDPLLSGIPVLFCAAERTMLASTLDATVARCALLCGADKYLSMDSFCLARGVTTSCKACPYAGKLCMYHELRLAIEDMLEEKDLVSILHSQPSGR
ncbi:MAG: hypothetical protein P4L53_19795 [Candidatus Obscuribacterales bacterium]|nr:hypothetical protein [Candidatus Obscuribacterales bacterium]